MEIGNATTVHRGSNARHDDSPRRKTVSGALPPSQDDDDDHVGPTDTMKFPWSSPSAQTSPTAPGSSTTSKVSGHRRSFSGGILAKLNFLRNVGEDGRPPSRDKEPHSPKSAKSRKSIDDDTPVTSPTSPKAESALAFALRPNKMRNRKGSLRKTALLGGKRIMSEGRERRNSLLQHSASNRSSSLQDPDDNEVPVEPPTGANDDVSPPPVTADLAAPPLAARSRQFSYENAVAQSSSESGWSESAAVTAARLSLVTEHKAHVQTASSSTNELGSPLDIKSPTSQTSYTSTTDDDDPLTFDRPAKAFQPPNTIALQKPLSSAATSYFPAPASSTSLLHGRHTSSQHQRSPLSHTISAASGVALTTGQEPFALHSYTETEYWGWIILFVTWLTFTVGMGSCLEIWSWAWDVGETPYAPPELENDPTLPIVGYYPALIVLTGVVAWVWITVAWVGMKYFRHAKIEV